MRLLVDTPVFLWAIAEPSRLSGKALRLLGDERNSILLSTVSLWEIVLKVRAGKLALPATAEYFDTHMRRLGISEVLPVTPPHVYGSIGLPAVHKDLFDRLLVSQCRVEQLALVSADHVFRKYSVDVLW